MNDEVLHSKTNNFLASVFFDNKSIEFLLDVSTGEFLASQGNAEYIDKLLQNFSPSEVLIQKKNNKMISRKILVMITIVLFRRLDLQKITHLKS
jgi:DNA mismatch repair ATPase MutS